MRFVTSTLCVCVLLALAACSDGVTPDCTDDAGCGTNPSNDAGASALVHHP
jgi:hypothetical protein